MHSNRQRIKYIISDLLATSAGWLLLYIYRYGITGHLSAASLGDYLSMHQVQINLWLCPLLWLGIFALSGYYVRPLFRSHLDELQYTFWSCVTGSLIFFFAMVVDDVPFINDQQLEGFKMLHVPSSTYVELLLVMFGSVFVPVYLLRYLITHHANQQITQGRLCRPTLLVGTGKPAQLLVRELGEQRRQSGYKIVEKVPSTNLNNDEIRRICITHDIQAILLAPDQPDQRIIDRLVYQLIRLGLPIYLRASAEEIQSGRVRVRSLTSLPMQEYRTDLIPPFSAILKRTMDITMSFIALLLLLPVFAVLAILIRLDSKGPIFYSQERLGLGGRPFCMFKLRTMQVDAEADGEPRLSKPDDNRITRLGAMLRKYRLDELPQFYNVLRGDMSLVGPRPEREFFVQQIMDVAPYYSKLLQLRPGITSWGQVKYGYAQNVFQMVERMRYDLMYVDNFSLGMDLKILGYTVRTVVTGQGI